MPTPPVGTSGRTTSGNFGVKSRYVRWYQEHTLQRYVHVLVPVLVLSFVLCTWDSEVRYKKVQIWHKSSKNSLISILTITFFNRIPDLSELFLFDKKSVQNFHGKIVANFKENIRFRGKIHIENPMFYFWPKNALFCLKIDEKTCTFVLQIRVLAQKSCVCTFALRKFEKRKIHVLCTWSNTAHCTKTCTLYQSATWYRTRTVQGFCSVRYGTVFSDFEFQNQPCTVTVHS